MDNGISFYFSRSDFCNEMNLFIYKVSASTISKKSLAARPGQLFHCFIRWWDKALFQAMFTGQVIFFPYGRSDIAWWNITSILRNCESLSETHSILSFPATIQPLLPIEHNGPGLEYKVSYRRQDVEEDWKENTVKRHSFVVKNTPTFVPYEIKIQAKNRQGFGPEPKLVTGYSGEDCEYKLIFFSVFTIKWEYVMGKGSLKLLLSK